MGKIILDMAMSLDGFIATQKKTYLYPIDDLKNTKALRQLIKKAGAVVMDKEAYNLAKGDFTNYEYQLPLFVTIPKAPSKIAKGENEKLKFTFVTDGIESAIEKAKAVAKNKNVMVIGLVDAAQQSLKSKKIDEIIIRLLPLLLGKGVRLFENFGKGNIKLKIVESKQFSMRNDIKFIVEK
jgi:dihydrofolate reductase